MKKLNNYIAEKLHITKDIKNVKEVKYSVGDVCLRLSLDKTYTNKEAISLALVKIDELDLEKGKMKSSSALLYYSELRKGNQHLDFGKSYKYNFKNINKFKYIYLKKELGVGNDIILIPQDEAVDILNKNLKDNKLNLHDYINTLEDKEIEIGEVFCIGAGDTTKKYDKIILDFYIDFLKKL